MSGWITKTSSKLGYDQIRGKTSILVLLQTGCDCSHPIKSANVVTTDESMTLGWVTWSTKESKHQFIAVETPTFYLGVTLEKQASSTKTANMPVARYCRVRVTEHIYLLGTIIEIVQLRFCPSDNEHYIQSFYGQINLC